jgi:hypothetical protein
MKLSVLSAVLSSAYLAWTGADQSTVSNPSN